MDQAAAEANTISTYGSITGSVAGSGQTDSGGSMTVTPPQVEISGGKESGGSVSVEGIPGGGSVSVEGIPGSGSVSIEGGSGGGSGEGNVYASGNVQAGLTESSVEGGVNSSAGGQVSAATQIQLTTSLHGLEAAVNGMSGQMRLLNGEISGISNTLTADLKKINNQIDAISDTIFDAVDTEQSDIVEDTSLTDIDLVTFGKVFGSQNTGTVYGDINVGGITGVMGIEYEFDPEDDITGSISGTQRKKYELKAIIQSCTNTGTVTAKRSYVAGIAGRMDLGLITNAESYGALESENGDYVGGIAGITGGTVRDSFVKTTLRGGSYVGGIVGCGVGESASGSSSTVSGCYSMVDIPEYEQYVGAISGENIGVFLENYFVSDQLAGINRMSYSGQAEPIAYDILLRQNADTEETESDAAEGAESQGSSETEAAESNHIKLPEQFRYLVLRFEADGETLKELSFDYGASFSDGIYPDIPQKDGYYAYWDVTELSNLHFDTVVTAVYEPYLTVLPSEDKRNDERPIFLVEGQFDKEAAMAVSPQANTPDEFDIFPDSIGDVIAECFRSTSLNCEIVEQWKLEIPEDGQETHTLRYLAPDGDGEKIDIYVKENGVWSKADTRTIGSYVVFEVDGSFAQIAVISTLSVRWIQILTAVIVLAIFLVVCRGIWKVCKKCKVKLSSRKKKGRWKPVIITLAIILGISGVTAVVVSVTMYVWSDVQDRLHIPQSVIATLSEAISKEAEREEAGKEETGRKETDGEASDDGETGKLSEELLTLAAAWNDINSRNPLCADLVMNADCGPLVLNDTFELYSWKIEDETISSIQKNDFELYVTDETICDKDGELVADTSGLSASASVDAAKLVEIAYQLYLNTEVECRTDGAAKSYTLSMDEKGIQTVAYAIAPQTADMDMIFKNGTVSFVVRDKKLQEITFACDGSMKIVLSDVEISLGAKLQFYDAEADIAVPEAVRKTLLSN